MKGRKKMVNAEIREEIKTSGLYYWEVAEEYGLNDGNFSRLLRKELSEEKKEKIKMIIAKLRKQKGMIQMLEAPIFLTINETAKKGIISKHMLQLMKKQGKLPHIMCGTRCMVNYTLLLEKLTEESKKAVISQGKEV